MCRVNISISFSEICNLMVVVSSVESSELSAHFGNVHCVLKIGFTWTIEETNQPKIKFEVNCALSNFSMLFLLFL